METRHSEGCEERKNSRPALGCPHCRARKTALFFPPRSSGTASQCGTVSQPLLQLPGLCDGCGKRFSLDHGLNCPNGGNVIRRHNEIRDVTGQLASLAYGHVTTEPVVRSLGTGGNDDGGLVCDLAVRGVWNPQTDASSYVNRPVRSVLDSAATAKKIKHKQACADRRADFTPFVCSTDGAVHREGQHFLRRLAARLPTKWEMPYARVMNFVRTRLSFAILRATGHCGQWCKKEIFFLEHRRRPGSCSFFLTFLNFRHVARVLKRGLHFAGGLGELPQKNFNFKVANTPKFNDFLQLSRNLGCPNIFCSRRKCQTSCKPAFPETVFHALNI